MRGIVIAKMLVLTLWGLYLAIGLTQGAGSDERRASGSTLSSRHATLSSRCLSPGSIHPRTPELAEMWIPATLGLRRGQASAGMTSAPDVFAAPRRSKGL